MKLKSLIKAIPFLTTLLLVIFLNLTNQKEYTKLKILIWNTPNLSLGTYLSLSIGSGFIFSYLFNTNLVYIKRLRFTKALNYKVDDEDKQTIEVNDSYINTNLEKILIERDIKDPSPTLNANFRVIGKTERLNRNFINNDNVQYAYSDISNDVEENLYNEQELNEENYYDENTNSIDWNDESFLSW